MSERNCRLYLGDILESGKAIQSYVGNLNFESFRDDRMRCSAVIREFQIIGEAVGKLSPELIARHAEVPWRDIKDFRNLLIHEYFGVDLRIVWNAIHQELPMLIKTVAGILDDLDKT